ncbi:MAG TPA: hypothetical protein VGB54_05980 [Allosphingosinicella sp.]|jgi:hypothetical protein
MQKTLIRAALAAALSLTLAPAIATAPVALAQSAATTIELPQAEVSQAHEAAHVHDEAPRVAPGQERADFNAWVARSAENREAVRAFRTHLKANGVEDVVPLWQLVRTSSSWRECAAGRFEVAPRDKWDNIVTTLKFIERDVIPAVGPVQAVSGYRNAGLNACSNGAPASAHRMFFALDLMPVNADVSRAELVRGVCAAHARDGRSFDTGLGFYSGLRFHVDSNGFRRWGADGRGATSPCVTHS